MARRDSSKTRRDSRRSSAPKRKSGDLGVSFVRVSRQRKLGEAMATRILTDLRVTYIEDSGGFSLTKFGGETEPTPPLSISVSGALLCRADCGCPNAGSAEGL